jgi:LPS export ABC transporter protein LptC
MINIKKVFFGFFVLWGLSSCTELDTNIYKRKRAQDSIVTREFAEKVTIEYTDSGFLKARIFSPILVAVKQPNNPYVEMKKGLKVDFYSIKGDIQSYLTADYAISYPNKKVIVVQRDVEILNTKGEVLNTEELRWDQVKGRIYTNKPVKITTKDQIITGIGLESNQSFSDWEILNVVASINVPYDKIPRPRPVVPGRGRY